MGRRELGEGTRRGEWHTGRRPAVGGCAGSGFGRELSRTETRAEPGRKRTGGGGRIRTRRLERMSTAKVNAKSQHRWAKPSVAPGVRRSGQPT